MHTASSTHEFFRFPHTPHLAWLASGTPRDDKVLSPDEAHALLHHRVVVEEKLDGANMGISFSSEGVLHVQNPYLTPETPLSRSELWFNPLTGK